MKLLLTLIIYFSYINACLACDLTEPDKLKHIEISKKATVVTKKVVGIVFLPIKPVKWIFNDKIQLVFPDNYVPELVAGTIVLTTGMLKEVPYDLLTPGKVSFCDIVADCYGIKEGFKE